MVFKLVRIDSEEPCKIQLPIGSHSFGRGKFLECEDKRVSRQHGELEITDDMVTMKALHQNPCFYKKKGDEEAQILRQHCTVSLGNGDKFGLLPSSYWYELVYCIVSEPDRKTPEIPNDEQNVESNRTIPQNVQNSDTKECTETTDVNNDSSTNDSTKETEVNLSLNDTIENKERSDDSQSLLPAAFNSPANDDQPDTEECTAPSPSKRSHSPDTVNTNDVKRIKVEPNIKQEPDNNMAAGPSNDNGVQDTDEQDDKKGNALTTPQSPARPALRERCMYGGGCYRRNPQHRVQFSHPQDADWGAGPRGVCPWGSGCRRRDPRHWRDHDHPAGTVPLPQGGKRSPKRRRQRSRTSSEENLEDLIVTGKRARKTLQRETWSGSESENEDPYQTDESEEWQPTSDYTDTQDYSQSQGD